MAIRYRTREELEALKEKVLQVAREEPDVTNRDLAARFNVSPSFLSVWFHQAGLNRIKARR